ncbi:GDSL-type esterase/lipase family protein [Ectopseudomonas composti]
MLRGLMLWCFCGAAAAACELPAQTVTGRALVGEFSVERANAGLIGFSGAEGDLTGRFDFDTLYEIATPSGSSRFRINDDFYVKGQTFLGNLHWERGSVPPSPGRYELSALSVERPPSALSMTMVGDSITWWSYGRYFRCLLSAELSGVGFTGPHVDTFGFGHAGEGGNKTSQMLARLDAVEPSSFYFVLAGTNDWPSADPAKTFENIREIAERLESKGGKVIVSTLLPRLDANDGFNQKVNSLIREWNGSGCNCAVVDLDKDFRALSDQKSLFWDAGVHPNLEGYHRIVSILAPKLKPLIR